MRNNPLLPNPRLPNALFPSAPSLAARRLAAPSGLRKFSIAASLAVFCWLLAAISPAYAAADEFSIGIIAPSLTAASDDSALRQAISETDDDNLAFVVVNGIKSAEENCSDNLYLERKILFDGAKNGLIVSLAGADWTGCRNVTGRSAAIERLNRLRELFFAEDFSFGASKLPMSRQSNAAKFRGYAENARWEFGPVLFATVNLPADNNHFLLAAGRNNEFEDRSIANREWLQRLVTIAARRKLLALVLFCDSDPLTLPSPPPRRDGYAEIRAQLVQLTSHFPGRILIVHDRSGTEAGSLAGINWKGNLGSLAVASGWLRLTVTPSTPALFSVTLNEITSSARATKKSAPK